MADEIAKLAAGRHDSVHPVRWAFLAVALLVLLIATVTLPTLALQRSERYTNSKACHQRRDQWVTLDLIILKVDKASPGTRAAYEPLLGPEPRCSGGTP